MRNKIIWTLIILAWVGIGWVVYEFVDALEPGQLDCSITWGREGCQ